MSLRSTGSGDVTMVKDATADYSNHEMQAALDVNIPNYANAVVTTDEMVGAISSLFHEVL
jgi:ureidoacrylate peracid hydrolase